MAKPFWKFSMTSRLRSHEHKVFVLFKSRNSNKLIMYEFNAIFQLTPSQRLYSGRKSIEITYFWILVPSARWALSDEDCSFSTRFFLSVNSGQFNHLLLRKMHCEKPESEKCLQTIIKLGNIWNLRTHWFERKKHI